MNYYISIALKDGEWVKGKISLEQNEAVRQAGFIHDVMSTAGIECAVRVLSVPD